MDGERVVDRVGFVPPVDLAWSGIGWSRLPAGAGGVWRDPGLAPASGVLGGMSEWWWSHKPGRE